jgi:hypothetical protein
MPCPYVVGEILECVDPKGPHLKKGRLYEVHSVRGSDRTDWYVTLKLPKGIFFYAARFKPAMDLNAILSKEEENVDKLLEAFIKRTLAA